MNLMISRVGALFFMLSVGLAYSQNMQIDTSDDPVLFKQDPLLRVLPKITNFEMLRVRLDFIAEKHPNLTFNDLVLNVSMIALPWMAAEFSLYRAANLPKYKNLTLLQLERWALSVGRYKSAFIPNKPPTRNEFLDLNHEAQIDVLVKQESNLNVRKFARTEMLSLTTEMASANNPYAMYISKKLYEVFESEVKDVGGKRSSNSANTLALIENDLRKCMDRYSRSRTYSLKLNWGRDFGRIAVGFFIALETMKFFEHKPEEGGFSMYETRLTDASEDIKRDFLLKLTDKKQGFGLSFEEAGQALILDL